MATPEAIDIDALVAIDMHAHVEQDSHGCFSLDQELLDDVAADFPGLTIICAHPSVPWQDSAISMATHKANVFIDLSGWLLKYFPPQLVRATNGLLKHNVLFGSDYPVLNPARWIESFDLLDIKPEVRPLVMKENAVRLLGLDPASE